MKKQLFFLLAILMVMSFLTYGQTTLTYTDVVKVDNVPKDALYSRAISWFATSYNNSKAVLQLENRIEGQIIGKATMPYNPTVYATSARTIGVINYTIKIFLKDGRYKYEITDFIHVPTGSNDCSGLSFGIITTNTTSPIQQKGQFKNWNNKVWNDIQNQIENNITPLIENLELKMNQKTEINNDNW